MAVVRIAYRPSEGVNFFASSTSASISAGGRLLCASLSLHCAARSGSSPLTSRMSIPNCRSPLLPKSFNPGRDQCRCNNQRQSRSKSSSLVGIGNRCGMGTGALITRLLPLGKKSFADTAVRPFYFSLAASQCRHLRNPKTTDMQRRWLPIMRNNARDDAPDCLAEAPNHPLTWCGFR